MSFATRFVYVGIGGSGLKIGKALERLLREEVCGPDGRSLIGRGGTFGNLHPFQLPDFIQTLYLDFSEQDLVSLRSDLLPTSPEVALRTATFVNALSSAGHSSTDVTDLLRVAQSAAVATADWLPPKNSEWGAEPAFAPLSTGAGQYPTIGRAALYAYMERFGAESLLRDFRRPLERIVGSIGQLEEYAAATTSSRNVVFLVGCSLSGGTGGGIFLDVIKLIAHEASAQLGETPFVIVPLVLMPSAFDNVLSPSKKKNAQLNATRALADLGRLIDQQNAPSSSGGNATSTYPGGHGGRGTLEVVLPPACVKTAFLFHRPADVPNDGALSERVARFAANLLRQPSVSKLASGPLGSGRTMTLLDKLVNNAGLLQERHPTFIGRRPFASAACVAIPDGRDQLIDLVTEQLLSSYLADTERGIGDDELERRKLAVQKAANLNPPEQAPIDPRFRQELTNPVMLDDEGLATAHSSYTSALRSVLPLGGKRTGAVPDSQSAGAQQALEYACRLGDSGSLWVEVLERAAGEAGTDLVGMLPAAKTTASAWARAQLVGRPKVRNGLPLDLPDAAALVRKERRGLGRSTERVSNPEGVQQLKHAEASQVDAAWRTYLQNPQGVAVKFTTAAGVLRGRIDNVIQAVEQWTQHTTNDVRRDRQNEVRDRYAYGPDFENLFDRVVSELGAQLGVAQPSSIEIARHILRRRQQEIVEVWKTQDSAEPAMLPIRLKDAIRTDVKQAFTQAQVYAGIEQILRDWATDEEGQLSVAVQEFRTKMLASITDSLVPPALDRDIEPMVTVAYPGEQNSRVEERLSEALATQASFARYLRLAAPTFVPRAAGNALIISISLVGQGLIDVPDGAEGLNTWVETAFRPNPTDRLAWRQREGYKDAIDFLDDTARAELLQRLLATAWNGELTAERAEDDGGHTPRFRSLRLRFGAADAPSLTISLQDMPFAETLAPLADAYLRAISSRYLTDTDTVSEILRELSRAVPRGFVERRPPTEEELQHRDLFLQFIPELSANGASDAEARELQRLQNQLEEQIRKGLGQAKRAHQIQEYFDFWQKGVPEAVNLSFGTLGYGTFAEVIDEIQQARAAAGAK